jgi:hypothetical protein
LLLLKSRLLLLKSRLLLLESRLLLTVGRLLLLLLPINGNRLLLLPVNGNWLLLLENWLLLLENGLLRLPVRGLLLLPVHWGLLLRHHYRLLRLTRINLLWRHLLALTEILWLRLLSGLQKHLGPRLRVLHFFHCPGRKGRFSGREIDREPEKSRVKKRCPLFSISA